jgi:enoyl-CoA hydratase
MNEKFVLVNAAVAPYVALVQLNRPKELNALNSELMIELKRVLQELDADENVHVIVLTGNDKAFAAGADIKEMAEASPLEMMNSEMINSFNAIAAIRKPIIAAVSGFALGGGAELMLHCDLIVASETTRIGQPEIKIGVMPGAGGTQRISRSIGKALAMEMILTGRNFNADEALQRGLINRILPVELYLKEAIKWAEEIAQLSPVALQLAKDAVLKSFNTPLDEGLIFEKRNFYLCFASEDQKEGMKAFIEKRKAAFKGR